MLAHHQLKNLKPAGPAVAELFRAGDVHPDAGPSEKIFPILWRHKLLLVLCTAIAVGATMLYLRRATPLYSSTARISIEQSVVPIANNLVTAPLSQNFIATQAEVIKSTNVLQLAEEKLKLLKTPAGTPRELKTFAGQTRYVTGLQSNLTVQLDPHVDIIDVSYVSPFPDEAAEIVNLVVDSYKDLHQSETHHNSAEVLASAQTEQKKREAELADAVKRLNALRSQNPNVGTPGGLVAMNQRLATLTAAHTAAQIDVAQSEGKFSPNHPAIQTAMREEQRLAELLEAARKDMEASESVEGDLTQLGQDVDRLREQANEADKLAKEAAAACATDSSVARIEVMEPGHPELSPVRPRKTQLLALSVILGLMLGSAAALGLEWADQRISGPEDTVAILRVPILGVVPVMKGRGVRGLRGLHVHLDPMSLVSESYRTIRTAICFGIHGDAGRTVLVTSPAAGDGKSTTAANLATAMTQGGERVLLIDADLRKPTQHLVFNLTNELGLASALTGECPAHKAIQPSAIKGLDVMTSGPSPRNPAEVLTRKAFVLLLQEVAGEYDRVILDSPPVTTVSDTLTLAAFCDITVLTLRAGKSTRTLAAATRDSLLSVKANIFGIVINGGEHTRSGYGVYSSYERAAPTTTVRVAPRMPGSAKGLNGRKNGHPNANGNGTGELTAMIVPSVANEPEDDTHTVVEMRPAITDMFQSGFPIRPVRSDEPLPDNTGPEQEE